MNRILPVLVLFLLSATVAAQTEGITTYCNPIDVDVKYNFEHRERGVSYRSGADPVILNQKGEYYLFETIGYGYWHSPDLIRWRHIEPNIWPDDGVVAPAARVVRDTVYLLQSNYDRKPIYIIPDPKSGQLEVFNPLLSEVPGAAGPWDPDIFYDEDSRRWFMYMGSSNTFPLWGIELDPERKLDFKGTVQPLFTLNPYEHGWERFGRDHRDTIKPFMEGAWMTKHNGRYYLQYGAPGTEHNVYANGTYVGSHPLGPFSYAPYNPVSYKPGGFMNGAGHGNTFQDRYGNFWNTGTSWVAVNWGMERRISMFPAGFDADGQMFASTRFGDFPRRVPTSRWTHPDELFPGWMLLSYRKPTAASSARDTLTSAWVTDENPRTYWLAQMNRPGEWLSVDLGGPRTIRAVQVNFTDHQSGIYGPDSTIYTQFRLHASDDGRQWALVADLTGEKRDRPNAYIELLQPVQARYVKYEHVYMASPHLAISDLRVFGTDGGDLPEVPGGLEVHRDADPRNAFLSWNAVPGAVGYNVRWGIAPNKLYQTYQVWADQGTRLEIRALNRRQGYCFAIEAFDESGVGRLGDVICIP